MLDNFVNWPKKSYPLTLAFEKSALAIEHLLYHFRMQIAVLTKYELSHH